MTQWMLDYANTKPVAKLTPNTVTKQDVLKDLQAISSKPWSQMNAADRAVYIRAFDEAHGPPDHLMVRDDRTGEPLPRGFYINNPDGTHSGVVARYGPEDSNMVDQPTKIQWGANNEIANAVKAYHAQNMSQISEAMGEGTRSGAFYNNSHRARPQAAHDARASTARSRHRGCFGPSAPRTRSVSLGLGADRVR